MAAKLVLDDLDHFEDLPCSWEHDLLKVVWRRLLLHDLQDLRRQLGLARAAGAPPGYAPSSAWYSLRSEAQTPSWVRLRNTRRRSIFSMWLPKVPCVMTRRSAIRALL